MTHKLSYSEILDNLKTLANPQNVAGMARFGINPHNTYGVSIPALRQIAREIGRDHKLATNLWLSGIHEARILASLVEVPPLVTEEQMDKWANDFDSWDVCDQCCTNLFSLTIFAYNKAFEWCMNQKEFVKRAGFVMMAALAVKDKKADDRQFEPFFANIKIGATDSRNFVKKAVNWALRQIGKRNLNLNQKAIEVANEIQKLDSASARWIAVDALRELNSAAIQARLRAKK
jgi:3-methyladenine DNA glycosylase AlkD